MKAIDSGSELSFEARATSEQHKGPLAYLCGRKGAAVAGVLGLQENCTVGTGLSFCDDARNAEPESFTYTSDHDPFYLQVLRGILYHIY